MALLLFTFGCGERSERVNVRLTMAERTAIDNRVIAHMDSLRPALEARCAEQQRDRVDVAVDSIVQRGLEEEARMRARLRQSSPQ